MVNNIINSCTYEMVKNYVIFLKNIIKCFWNPHITEYPLVPSIKKDAIHIFSKDYLQSSSFRSVNVQN